MKLYCCVWPTGAEKQISWWPPSPVDVLVNMKTVKRTKTQAKEGDSEMWNLVPSPHEWVQNSPFYSLIIDPSFLVLVPPDSAWDRVKEWDKRGRRRGGDRRRKREQNKLLEKFGAISPGYLTRGWSGVQFFLLSAWFVFTFDVSKVQLLQWGKGGGGGLGEMNLGEHVQRVLGANQGRHGGWAFKRHFPHKKNK